MATKVPLAELLSAMLDLPWQTDSSGVKMANGPSGGLPKAIMAHKAIHDAVAEIVSIRAQQLKLPNLQALHMMINLIPPGIVVPKHRDFLKDHVGIKYPILERWHLPIATNDKATWWDETIPADVPEKDRHMPLGVWCGPVPYWKEHNVSNLGTGNRIHLVVDLDLFVTDKDARY